ncbi:hypothetical protein K435DRAFT_809446, partial [Dendrothele bispora CBS 962.96]
MRLRSLAALSLMSLPLEGFSLLPSEITVLVQALQRTPHLTGPEKELLDRFRRCLGENLSVALGSEANGSVPSSSSLPSSGSLSLAQESDGITLEKRKKSAYCDPDLDEGNQAGHPLVVNFPYCPRNGKKARMARNPNETTEYEETDQMYIPFDTCLDQAESLVMRLTSGSRCCVFEEE